MRSSQKSGRSRGKGNRGKTQGHSPNRVYESAGPEGKVRGTPQQIIDKYLALARDAQLSGDRVGSENFLQHAEHYARILLAVQEAQQQDRRDQNQQPNGGQDRQDDDQSSSGQQNGQPSGDRQNNQKSQPQPRADRRNGENAKRDDDQPASDGLEAIDAAEEGPGLVETPESKSAAPKPRTRRPRPPKPPVETSATDDGPDAANVETAE